MKNSRILRLFFVLILTFSILPHAYAQPGYGGFSPGGYITFIDPVGPKILLHQLSFVYYPYDSAFKTSFYINFVGPRGITSDPTGVEVPSGSTFIEIPVSVFVNLDSVPTCLPEGIGGLGAYDGTTLIDVLVIYGYTYNPKIIGRIHLNADSINFGSVPIEANDSTIPDIEIDTTGSLFRKVILLNAKSPFSADSLIPFYCGSFDYGIQYGQVYFKPTEIKQYVDTTFIYDPIRKDSTMLILLGEGVAAGVSPDVAKSNSLRINPNPCDRSAAISLPGEDIEEVTVQNILGERVIESRMEPCNSFNMNTSELPAGIYFVEVQTRQRRYRQRIIVSH